MGVIFDKLGGIAVICRLSNDPTNSINVDEDTLLAIQRLCILE
jgi:hypothetical protein